MTRQDEERRETEPEGHPRPRTWVGDTTTALVRSVPNPDRFAVAGLVSVILLYAVAFQFGTKVTPTTLGFGVGAVLVIVLSWIWIRAKQARAEASAAAEAPEPALTKLELIARGVAAETWRAYDPQLRRRVVKKLLTDREREEDFVDGVRQAIRLSDRANYMTIYSGCFAGPEVPYFVMQYLEGGSLRDYLEAQGTTPLNIEFVRRIVYKVGEAMHYAHQQSVKLGNIKASNILLDANDEPHISPRTRLTFLNPSQLRAAVREREVTLEDLVYVAPELLSAVRAPSARAELNDQYALGILAYELLTSKLPASLPTVHGDEPARARVERTCALILDKDFAAFEELPPAHTVRRDVPMRISEILAKMTSLDPDKRYDRLDQALAALHSAEQSILLAARDSYIRCLSVARSPSFFECFYELFTADATVAAHFAGFTAERWTEQHGKLQGALDACFDFAKLLIPNVEIAEPNVMTRLVGVHGPGLGIGAEEYAAFVDALVATVCGEGERAPYDPECADSKRREEIERAWREMMRPIVDYFLRAAEAQK
jgi:hypothetical protein